MSILHKKKMFFAKTINSMINFPYLIQNKCKKKIQQHEYTLKSVF